ncbi:MAG: deoxyribose-phosphate aldolase [Cytophagales bacterium]|nr:deoxyribose-phosphate aldolase [Bernardetiaceae bacterium]MDW8210110.1 deoxyribose-phosphate aldolase [Cytophagales bacterium]
METLNQHIEYTLLRPTATSEDFEVLVQQAIDYKFLGVCVPPYWVKKVRRDLDLHHVKVITVVGFPLGYNRSETKLRETEIALSDGAHEIDLAMNLSAFKTGVISWVKGEIAQIAKLCHENYALLKVILETSYLSDEEIIRACRIAQDAGADFVKTSTGFSNIGATEHAVRLMRQTVGEAMGVKASGGIRTKGQALALIAAGADRIGSSAGPALMS